MKKVPLFVYIVLLLACETPKNDKTETDTTEAAQKLTSKEPITYSSDFAVGSSQHSQMILDLWKDFDENTIDESKADFADSVTMMTSDGTIMSGLKDSMLNNMKAYRDMFTKVNSTVKAIMPAHSNNKNENWVLIWGTEHRTTKDNKEDSVHLQETWRINKNGKVDLMMQYARAAMPPTL